MVNQSQEKNTNLTSKKRKRSNTQESEESEEEKFFNLNQQVNQQSEKMQNFPLQNNPIASQNFNKFKKIRSYRGFILLILLKIILFQNNFN